MKADKARKKREISAFEGEKVSRNRGKADKARKKREISAFEGEKVSQNRGESR